MDQGGYAYAEGIGRIISPCYCDNDRLHDKGEERVWTEKLLESGGMFHANRERPCYRWLETSEANSSPDNGRRPWPG